MTPAGVKLVLWEWYLEHTGNLHMLASWLEGLNFLSYAQKCALADPKPELCDLVSWQAASCPDHVTAYSLQCSHQACHTAQTQTLPHQRHTVHSNPAMQLNYCQIIPVLP